MVNNCFDVKKKTVVCTFMFGRIWWTFFALGEDFPTHCQDYTFASMFREIISLNACWITLRVSVKFLPSFTKNVTATRCSPKSTHFDDRQMEQATPATIAHRALTKRTTNMGRVGICPLDNRVYQCCHPPRSKIISMRQER